jgi:hypothetical protein
MARSSRFSENKRQGASDQPEYSPCKGVQDAPRSVDCRVANDTLYFARRTVSRAARMYYGMRCSARSLTGLA